MKVKITLIVAKIQKGVPFNHPQFFQIHLTDDNQFPHAYISTKDEQQTLSNLFDTHFHIGFNWVTTELSGFRKVDDREVEVTYISYMPEVLGANRSGSFFSSEDIKNQNIEVDPYYEKLLSTRSRNY